MTDGQPAQGAQEAEAGARVRRWDSGPLEGLQLRTWTWWPSEEPGPAVPSDAGRVFARLIGTHRVRCGCGSEHPVRIDEQIGDALFGAGVRIALAEDDVEAAEELGLLLLEQALRGWTDPCP